MDSTTTHDTLLDDRMNERSLGTAVRDTNGKIIRYDYKILNHDAPALEGSFTLDEMNLIYKLYSFSGANLDRRTVSREFDLIIFNDFIRILPAFQITKKCPPFAPHISEMYTIDELVAIGRQTKENQYFKKIEQDNNKLDQIRVQQLLKENFELKEVIREAESFPGLNFEPIEFVSCQNASENTLLVYLSDMHIGAHNSGEGVYDNPYSEEEVTRRLQKVFYKISQYKNVDKVIIVNLGDAIDGYNASTTRPSSNHVLPQNMTNRQQGETFVRVVTNFFHNIIKNINCNEIQFYSVCESNHGGDFEAAWVNGLICVLDMMGVKCHFARKPIEYFNVNNRTFIYTHGKDNLNQFKNLPLTLDQKAEAYLNEFIDRSDIRGKISVIKGDLHQSAITKGKKFTYHSCASLFGSSHWIHANFGFTAWGCDYAILDKDGNIINGLIED